MTSAFSKGSMGFLIAAGAVAPLVAYSQVYLTEEQATQSIFPRSALKRKTVELTPAEIKRIEELSGEKVRNSSVILWADPAGDIVFVDQVLGKHEFITYAVGISKSKKVGGIEIMEYRETYGHQVRAAEWRKQFVGKDSAAPLRLKEDIVNISGATLSSAHITSGVRRLLHTYDVVRSRL